MVGSAGLRPGETADGLFRENAQLKKDQAAFIKDLDEAPCKCNLGQQNMQSRSIL
jgi:hypothetical protein